jgi:hypothetical protein
MLTIGALIAAVLVTGIVAKAWKIPLAAIFALGSGILILCVPFGEMISLVASCIAYPIAQRRVLAMVAGDDAPALDSVD